MRRLLAFGLALALAVLAVTTFAKTPEAQTADRVLDACAPGKETIDARALPAALLTPERCPVAGRAIEDGRVGSVVPPTGGSVHAEVLTTSGAEELEIGRREDGTIELQSVGEDAGASGEDLAKAGSPGECSDAEYTPGDRRVPQGSPLHYEINRASTPSELTAGDAVDAIRRAGTRVASTNNNCHMGDRVPAGLVYEGKTGRGTNIEGLSCGTNDENSVVAFGDLPSGILAVTCNWDRYNDNNTVASDIKINKQGVRWTTSPRSRSCRDMWDLEGVMTHERGHTFGMGHVPETGHGNLTMSTNINGTCQMAERSLGRGDVLGLGRKYR
jgi:hypothetical protein